MKMQIISKAQYNVSPPHILLSMNVNFSMHGSEMEMPSLIILLRSMVLNISCF